MNVLKLWNLYNIGKSYLFACIALNVTSFTDSNCTDELGLCLVLTYTVWKFGWRHTRVINTIIRWRSISMRAGPAFLQFDWSKAGLSMDLPVFVNSHTKTGFKFFHNREDLGSFFMCLELCLEIFDFKPRRENITGLLFCPDWSLSMSTDYRDRNLHSLFHRFQSSQLGHTVRPTILRLFMFECKHVKS